MSQTSADALTADLPTVGGYVPLPRIAALLGLQPRRLQDAAHRGALPAVKTGPHKGSVYLVRPEDVAVYLQTVRRGWPKGKPRPDMRGPLHPKHRQTATAPAA